MKTTVIFLSIVFLGLWLADCSTANKSTATAVVQPDPLAADRAKYTDRVRAEIAGKENMAADSVFENIARLKNVSAARLLVVMDTWGKVLGVSCDHCHVNNEWASEVKPEKEITRQMMDLVNNLNKDLKNMDALKSYQPSVSCYTCHRGDTRPATRPK